MLSSHFERVSKNLTDVASELFLNRLRLYITHYNFRNEDKRLIMSIICKINSPFLSSGGLGSENIFLLPKP